MNVCQVEIANVLMMLILSTFQVMERNVLWTDLVGTLQEGPKGPYWAVKDEQLQHWSLQVHQKDKRSPLQLTFAYRINKSWIPNPGNPIKVAALGTKDRLDVSVHEGLEVRVLSIDCKKHVFHSEPFFESISKLPTKEKEEIEAIMVSGVSKKAINFVLGTLEDINESSKAEQEASRKQKKKQAETVLKSRTQEGGSSRSRTPQSRKGSQKSADDDMRATTDTTNTKKGGEIVQFSDAMEEDDIERPDNAKRPASAKRASSPGRKTKPKKMKSAEEETPLVLTATEKGRVISHGEEPSLEEAAKDRKKFIQLFGHLYPFGVEAVFRVNIKKMTSAKAYQVTRPLDDAGVALMKNYLIQTPPAWPHHNLCLMPKLQKGEKWKEGMTWDDIKDGQFIIINGQHSVAASREIIIHKDTEPSLRDKLKVWPCTIVWTDDPSMTVRLSYTLNNSNSFNKFTPTWSTQIMYCRRVWVKLGRPHKQRVNAAEGSIDPDMALAWKVCTLYQRVITFGRHRRWKPCCRMGSTRSSGFHHAACGSTNHMFHLSPLVH